MSFDPSLLHSNGFANGTGVGLRETGVVEKLLSSYGFIQCSERQARLFFHCSQYNGNLQELKIGGKRDDILQQQKHKLFFVFFKLLNNCTAQELGQLGV